MPDKNVQAPDGSVIAFPDSMADDDISAVMRKQYPNPSEVLTQQTNSAATGAGIAKPGISPVPLPGAGRKILGGRFPSPLDPSENVRAGLAPNAQPLASPIAPFGAAASIPKAIGSLVGGYTGAKGVGLASDNPWYRDLGGVIGAMLGGGIASSGEDLTKNMGRIEFPEKINLPGGFKIPINRTLPSEGTGAPLPDAGEFYANKAADLTRRGVQQGALDRAAARSVPKQLDPVAAAVKARTASWIPTRMPAPEEAPAPVDPVAEAVKARNAAWLPTRVKPAAAPPQNPLMDILQGKGMSSAPESVQQMPPVKLPWMPSTEDAEPVTSTGPRAQIVTKGTVPQKSLIVDPDSPAPHVEGSYWSFSEPSLRRALLSGDRDAAVVYKQRFGQLPAGSKYVTDVGDNPNRGIYRSRK